MSRFLQLPKELRLQIYEDVFNLEIPSNYAIRSFVAEFVNEDSVRAGHVIIGGPPARPWNCRPDPYHPTLLQVSSSIRHEALPLFYQGRVVILLLRYREGPMQVQRWIDMLRENPIVTKRVKHISVQYFEHPHRSTVVLLNCMDLEISNRSWLLHPLTKVPFMILDQLDNVMAAAKLAQDRGATGKANVVRQIVRVMTNIVERTTLRRHSMANLRLHGYSDFSQRFEMIRNVYNSADTVNVL
ncbi:hypothetical protein CERZMDRAFT_89911 [Cercospora zeae-maydis SCOH1-5]|uniref:2EXR domain-containing protein n=1 Tax=Cercospora zeae-maydis SCOH1-5 TaxID=717836 RepID=A0A6A6FT33_9PEZI|nr:hypothetical protein CERZMDRAFT_89911 [Cercospora zeae-maydis SCOH1-5]